MPFMPERNHGTQIIAEKYFNGDIIITENNNISR